MNSNSEITARLQLAIEAGIEAGQSTLDHFQKDVAVQRKADNSPVTIADQNAEKILRQRISDAFPQDAILGEEFGEKDGNSPYRWILDPIDGTKSFITGVPLYGTMIGVEVDGRAEIGLVYIPALNEGVYASRGTGAWQFGLKKERKPAHVCDTKSMSDGVFLTSEVGTFAERNASDAYEQLQSAAYFSRTWGDCYGYLLVATGRAVAMVDPIMNVWDAAALQPIMEEAGGTFTDWQGNPTIHAGEGIGTNGHVLEEVLDITRQFKQP